MINCMFENGSPANLRHAVVDTLVIKNEKILMVKRAERLLDGGKWGIIGGFIDLHETIADAVEREVLEETGWTVSNLRLFRIVDNPRRAGEDRQNIAFVYIAEADRKIGEPDDESDEQRWFSLNEIPDSSHIAFDHADSIALYKKYIKDKVRIPMLPS